MTATATAPIKGRYVKLVKTGRVIPVDHHGILLTRVGIDCYECDAKGVPIDASPAGLAKSARIEGSAQQAPIKAPVVAEVQRVTMAPEAAKTEAEIAADNEKKAKLVQYAQDRHSVALDPSDSLEVIKARVKRLNDKAGVVDQPEKAEKAEKTTKRRYVKKAKPAAE